MKRMLKILLKLSCLTILLLFITAIVACDDGIHEVIDKEEQANNPAPDNSSSIEADFDAPVPGGDGAIVINDLSETSLKLEWETASDAVTPVSNLQYMIYFSSENTINTIDTINTYGEKLLLGWTVNIDTAQINSLVPGTTYYFNILVRDEAGNSAPYEMATATTDESDDDDEDDDDSDDDDDDDVD